MTSSAIELVGSDVTGADGLVVPVGEVVDVTTPDAVAPLPEAVSCFLCDTASATPMPTAPTTTAHANAMSALRRSWPFGGCCCPHCGPPGAPGDGYWGAFGGC